MAVRIKGGENSYRRDPDQRFPSRHRLRTALLAGWLGVGCGLVSSLHAEKRITTYLDSRGHVVFANELAAAAGSGDGQATAEPAWNSRANGPQLMEGLITQAASAHQVDPKLVRAIVQVESNFNPYAVSPRGARGLMQLIPATARRFGVENVYDPRANLEGGIRYLKYLMGLYDGDLQLSLAAYNAGENAVGRHNGIPPFSETQDYLRKIFRLYPRESPKAANPEIVKFVDRRGIVHFSNTDLP